jgi:hypothetical protein
MTTPPGWADHCTCRPGRDHDGSEFGPCDYCERQAYEDNPCETCGGSGKNPDNEAWPCRDCSLTVEEWTAWQDTREGMNKCP